MRKLTTEYLPGMTNVVVTGILLVAVYQDISTGKVKNRLIALALYLGLVHLVLTDGPGNIEKLLGFAIRVIWPIALLYILYYIRALGAGDIKLFAAISPFFQWDFMISVVLLSFFIGAGFSCYRILKNKEMPERLFNLKSYAHLCAKEKRILTYSTLKKESSYIRFSICILLGFLFAVLGDSLF